MKSSYQKFLCNKIYRYVIVYSAPKEYSTDIQKPFSNKWIRQPKIIFAEKNKIF